MAILTQAEFGDLVRCLADELGVPGMIAPQVMNLMRIARAKGMGVDDSSSVIRVYEQALGREVRPK